MQTHTHSNRFPAQRRQGMSRDSVGRESRTEQEETKQSIRERSKFELKCEARDSGRGERVLSSHGRWREDSGKTRENKHRERIKNKD